MKPVYLNHAYTGLPRSPAAVAAAHELLEGMADADPAVHVAAQRRASAIPDETRAAVARLVGARPAQVHLTPSTTLAVTAALRGFLREGDVVTTTDWNHFALGRPLMRLERARGVIVRRVASRADGSIDVDRLREAMVGARMLAITHACNVTGDVFDLGVAAELAEEAGAALLVDAAASAGAIDLDVGRDRTTFLAFTSHKRLHGLPGAAALIVAEGVEIAPLVEGTVAGFESHEDIVSDAHAPAVAGTPAALAYAAFAAVADEENPDLTPLCEEFHERFSRLGGWTLHGVSGAHARVPIFAITPVGGAVAEVAARLQKDEIVATHGTCNAPWIHHAIGTTKGGVLRISPGAATTADEVERLFAHPLFRS